jgi:hypothetical protein
VTPGEELRMRLQLLERELGRLMEAREDDPIYQKQAALAHAQGLEMLAPLEVLALSLEHAKDNK